MHKSIQGMEILDDNSVVQKYNVGDIPIYIANEHIEDFPDRQTVPHWNEGLEVIYVCKGTMYIVVNGKFHALGSGDICIIDAGCVHYLESNENNDCDYYVGIIEESIFSTASEIVRKYVNPVFHSYHPNIEIITSSSEYNVQMLNFFRAIAKLNNEKPWGFDLQIVAHFHGFLALLCEALDKSYFLSASIESKADTSMRKMLTHIHKNYSKTLRIEELCAEGNVSRNQCFHLFNKYTGDTPNNYILKYRLNASKHLLSSTDLPIANIATTCGFTHQSHFTNHFSKYYGTTPLQYRKAKKAPYNY